MKKCICESTKGHPQSCVFFRLFGSRALLHAEISPGNCADNVAIVVYYDTVEVVQMYCSV